MRATEVWRRLQFNLRTFFVLLTALAVWLGAVANRAREQREAANAIQAIGGAVIYQWQRRGDRRPVPGPLDIPVVPGEPDGPAWLRRIVGDDFFQAVEIVAFSAKRPTTEVEILKSLPHLQRLRGLELVAIPTPISRTALSKLKLAVPRCQVVHGAPTGYTDQ
ncbi:MAG TPA: hypothetical protein VJ783_06385 [Pirellulales bacterium]|nr:hypothetical protein [Pirellulales bacterium]